MSIRYRLNPSRSLVTLIVEDSISPRDLRRLYQEMKRDADATGLRHLILLSERLATLSPVEIVELAAGAKRLPRMTTAPQAIAAFTDLHFGQARICLSHLNVPETQLCLFRELRDALKWLGFAERAARIELQTLLSMN